MVEDTGEETGPGALRPIGLPRPVDVKADDKGWPVAVRVGRRWLAAQVVDRWRIDDEWWRGEPVRRMYFRASLEDGRAMTLYQDLGDQRWYRQGY